MEAVKEEPPSEGGGAIVKEAAKVRVQQQASSSKASSQGSGALSHHLSSSLSLQAMFDDKKILLVGAVQVRVLFACYAASLVDCCTHLTL